jgi:radical SAM-linked protein
MMRLSARLTAKADLPVRFTQGYNPRPVLSLPCPRPVGIATRCDLLVISLDTSADVNNEDMARRLAEKLTALAPEGLRFLRAEPLEGKRAPQPRRIDYEMPVTAEAAAAIRRRLDELAPTEVWPVDRLAPPGRSPEPAKARKFDMRPLVAGIRVESGMLRWSFVPRNDRWARSGELLKLLGMGDPAAVACVTRTYVEYGN